ncbi:MAG: class I SAM-dependent methyltransferase [Gaiellaceae bacterium MAG52_C11]|nr:class I SAM-dependent methyltransferase [Candidatus Gaiellasilicea maunaloa]
MLRETIKGLVARAGRSSVGKNLIHAAVLEDSGRARYSSVERWPERLDGFEDLAFLFASNQLSHGIASLQLDEAALLYRLARNVSPEATVAEIGRFKGGSTLLLASALPDGAELWSYDLHVALRADLSGPELDRDLAGALERYGLAVRVHLLVADSRTAEPPPRPCELVFVDGDHSYSGARADYERWRELVASGGNILFHDAVDTRGYGNHYPGVVRLVGEIERDDRELERRPDAGSIAHFVRRG